MPVTNEPTVVATGVAAAAAKEAAEIELVAAFDELQRLRSELHGGAAGVEQRALQMVLCVGARADSLVLVQTALRLGGEPAPRSSRLLRGHSVVNERGLSPLHIAAGEGHAHVVQMLLAASAPPTLLSGAGAPPLVVAAQSDHAVDALETLLQAGAPLAMRDDRRQTALHAAARAGCVEATMRLLSAARADEARKLAERVTETRSNREPFIELRDRWHRTALHWAVVNQRLEIVSLLVAAGASVNGLAMPPRKHNRSTSLPRETPLHSSARLPPNAAAPLIRKLLAASADPNRSDQFGQTPLHVAVVTSQHLSAVAVCEFGAGTAVAVVALLDGGGSATCLDDARRTPRQLLLMNE